MNHAQIQRFVGVALLVLLGTGCERTVQKLSNIDQFAQTGAAMQPEKTDGLPKREAPMSLTASDGAGLQLRQLWVSAVVEGPLAFTEMRMTFHNTESRQREGRFAVTLPPRAAISRFAMKLNDNWQEGEVVEKHEAQRIYDDFLHRKQDPALLETDAGNVFSARVFPIPPNGDKEIVIAYSSELAKDGEPFVVPLQGLGEMDDLDVEVTLHKPRDDEKEPIQIKTARLVRTKFKPQADFEVYPAAIGDSIQALRHEGLALARVQVPDRNSKADFEHAVILFDTSASQAVDFAGRLNRLDQLVAFTAAHGAKRLSVVAFDQAATAVFDGTPAGWGKEQHDKLEVRGALGASDLAKGLEALQHVLVQKDKPDKPLPAGSLRVILFGNGVTTAGEKQRDQLVAKIKALGVAGLTRLDTVEMSAARDLEALRAFASAGLSTDGIHVQLDSDSKAKANFDPLAKATYKAIRVQVPGSNWVWPQELRGMQAGDSALVYADIPAGAAFVVELTGGVDDKITPKVQAADPALLQRAWVAARIRRLLDDSQIGDPDMRPMAKAQALKLSIEHRVLCELTALLVLETEQDYERYHIDRKALSDILTVSEQGTVERIGRDALHGRRRAQQRTVEVADGDDKSMWQKVKGWFGGGSTEDKGSVQKDPDPLHGVGDVEVVTKGKAEQGADKPTDSARAPGSEPRAERAQAAAAAPPPAPAPAAAAAPGAAPAEVAMNLEEKPKAAEKAAAEPERAESEDRKRQARDAVQKKAIAGAFVNRGPATKLFAADGDDEGAVAAKQFGGEAADNVGAGGLKLDRAGSGGATMERVPSKGKGFADRNNGMQAPIMRQQEAVVTVKIAGMDGPDASGAKAEVAKVVSRKTSAIKQCYERALRDNPDTGGKVKVTFTVGTAGTVIEANVSGADGGFGDCIRGKFMAIRGLPILPSPATFSQQYIFAHEAGWGQPVQQQQPQPHYGRDYGLIEQAMADAERRKAAKERAALRKQKEALNGQQEALAYQQQELSAEQQKLQEERRKVEEAAQRKKELDELQAGLANTPNVSGKYAKIRDLIHNNKGKTAVSEAWNWRNEDVGDVLALVALGEAFEATEDFVQAGRAYGSLIDLFPSRVDLRRFAGTLLQRTGDAGAALAIDDYREALVQRPDHPAGYHLLAMALAQAGAYDEALATLKKAREQHFRDGAFSGVDKIFDDDESIINVAKLAKLAKDSGQAPSQGVPSLRFVLTWETDANDVDFHIFDNELNHASFRNKQLASGGELYADITTGYGPESVRIADAKAYPYRLMAQYYSMGPMGYGMGAVQVLRHDGKMGFGFESRTFVIMQDHAYVDLGVVDAKTAPILY